MSYADVQSRYPHLKKDQFEWTVGQTSISTGIDNDISYSVFIATKWNEEEKAAWQIEEDKRLELLRQKREKQKKRRSVCLGKIRIQRTKKFVRGWQVSCDMVCSTFVSRYMFVKRSCNNYTWWIDIKRTNSKSRFHTRNYKRMSVIF